MRNPFGSLMGIPRALLQVPHGGAANMPTQFGDLSQVQQRSRPALVVRSAMRTRPAFFCLRWSTPNDADNPNCWRQAVTRAEPAQNSMMNGSLAAMPGSGHGSFEVLCACCGAESGLLEQLLSACTLLFGKKGW